MKISIKKGFGFGLASGVITTLGLIVGLYSSTNSRIAIVSGILIIALVDAMSDSFGIHVSEELEKGKFQKRIWETTLSTLFFKFIFAISFIIPFLFFKIFSATIISIFLGLCLISVFSFHISKKNNQPRAKAVFEHLSLAVFIIIITYLIGKGIILILQ